MKAVLQDGVGAAGADVVPVPPHPPGVGGEHPHSSDVHEVDVGHVQVHRRRAVELDAGEGEVEVLDVGSVDRTLEHDQGRCAPVTAAHRASSTKWTLRTLLLRPEKYVVTPIPGFLDAGNLAAAPHPSLAGNGAVLADGARVTLGVSTVRLPWGYGRPGGVMSGRVGTAVRD